MVPRVFSYSPDPKDGCSWYRSIGPLAALAKRGEIQLTHAHQWATLTWAEVAGHHIGFMQRPSDPEHVAIAGIIRQQMPLWVDFDDDLYHVAPDMGSYEYFQRPDVRESIATLCRMADAITVSTHNLVPIYQPHARPGVGVRVVPNAWNDDLLGQPRCVERPADYNRIVFWRGSSYHQGDFLAHREAIAEVANTVGRDWRWVFMGALPWQLNGLMRAEYIPAADIVEYQRHAVRSLNPAITIVPLAATRLNRSKSNVAWLETAGSCGSRVVAPVGVSAEWDMPGVVGYGAGWSFGHAVAATIASHDRDQSITWDAGRRSVEYIQANLLLSDVNRARMSVIDQLIGS